MKKQILDFKNTNQLDLFPMEDTMYVISTDNWKDQKSLIVNLGYPNVSCKIRCGYKVSSGEVVNLITTIIHKAPNTSSDAIVRAVLFDGGVSNYIGKVIIKKSARGSLSNLENATLVVGEATHNHTEPIMQIETDDVTASHSSFTGRIGKEQLYYLMSRGLSLEESQGLLINAFLEPLGV